jgi:peptide-methionine (S)-S-oxide reductase
VARVIARTDWIVVTISMLDRYLRCPPPRTVFGLRGVYVGVSTELKGQQLNNFTGKSSEPVGIEPPRDSSDLEGLERATFAAGCFWGVEASFREIEGVVRTRVGYTGGRTADPSYEQVCSDTTGHAEAVEVWFDPALVSYDQLLNVFWTIHDPTTPNRQGWDLGSQYRSAIFFHDADQEKLAIASRGERQGALSRSIVTEIAPARTFYEAEDYHQRYFEKHGGAVCATTLR